MGNLVSKKDNVFTLKMEVIKLVGDIFDKDDGLYYNPKYSHIRDYFTNTFRIFDRRIFFVVERLLSKEFFENHKGFRGSFTPRRI
jgi:hypothetical protein